MGMTLEILPLEHKQTDSSNSIPSSERRHHKTSLSIDNCYIVHYTAQNQYHSRPVCIFKRIDTDTETETDTDTSVTLKEFLDMDHQHE